MRPRVLWRMDGVGQHAMRIRARTTTVACKGPAEGQEIAIPVLATLVGRVLPVRTELAATVVPAVTALALRMARNGRVLATMVGAAHGAMYGPHPAAILLPAASTESAMRITQGALRVSAMTVGSVTRLETSAMRNVLRAVMSRIAISMGQAAASSVIVATAMGMNVSAMKVTVEACATYERCGLSGSAVVIVSFMNGVQ